jgi:hypothetical protein
MEEQNNLELTIEEQNTDTIETSNEENVVETKTPENEEKTGYTPSKNQNQNHLEIVKYLLKLKSKPRNKSMEFQTKTSNQKSISSVKSILKSGKTHNTNYAQPSQRGKDKKTYTPPETIFLKNDPLNPVHLIQHGYNIYNNVNADVKEDKKIIALNFEDDTFKVVFKLDADKMNIITDVYQQCGIDLDIEETYISVPSNYPEDKLKTIINRIINSDLKNDFVTQYIPKTLEIIKTQMELDKIEAKFNKTTDNDININKLLKITDKSDILESLDIHIPQNMIYNDNYFYNDESGVHLMDILNKKEKKLETSDGFYKTTNLEQIYKLGNGNNSLVEEVMPYDHDYNVLKPKFAENCLKLVEEKDEDDNKLNEHKLYFVFLNVDFLKSLVIENPTYEILDTLYSHSEYGFVELFKMKIHNDDAELISCIKKQFNNSFYDINELNEIIENTSQIITYNTNKRTINASLMLEEKSVKAFLNNNFNFSNDVNKKMKASAIHNLIINSDVCKVDKNKISGFKTRLSKYLQDLGLKKKRYNDGFYYYGIVNKYDIEGENPDGTKFVVGEYNPYSGKGYNVDTLKSEYKSLNNPRQQFDTKLRKPLKEGPFRIKSTFNCSDKYVPCYEFRGDVYEFRGDVELEPFM